MFNLEITETDKKWLKQKYPGLTVSQEDGIQVLAGEFSFHRDYQGEEIADSYQIRIEMRNSQASDLPRVFETNSRIKNIAKERDISRADLHAYEDGSACLCIKMAEPDYFPDGFSFQPFITELVEPYFYAQSFFEKFDIWPWTAYSHNILGWFEWYCDQGEMSSEVTCEFFGKIKTSIYWKHIRHVFTIDDSVKGHHRCLCGSGKKYRKCHENVFRGIWKLQHDLKEFAIQI